jgi:xylulokinase
LFPDHEWPEFQKLVVKLARQGAIAGKKHAKLLALPHGSVRFDPYLAGDRMSIEQRQAAFTGLTLATTREQMLAAMLEALAAASAARVALLKQIGAKIRRDVVVTGGAGKLTAVFHRDWPGKWSFRQEEEATLRGLSRLEPRER